MSERCARWRVPTTLSRRAALEAGAAGLLGLAVPTRPRVTRGADDGARGRSVVYIFLSGGLSQIDSFDPKPEAPEEIRGEFAAIATRTPGLFVCEHLPRLAACSHLWSLVRSLTHGTNDHSVGHYFMLTGRSTLPSGFDPAAPSPTDEPSIAAVAGAALPAGGAVPPAVVLPERLVHYSGRVIPGQFAGLMGRRREPWFVEASPYEPAAYGAYPEYEFDHQQRAYTPRRSRLEALDLAAPDGFARRVGLLGAIEGGDVAGAAGEAFEARRRGAVALLTDPALRRAFDLDANDPRTLDRYGRNAFGWSLLMARRLVECGVGFVQVNLGNNETWDTHGNAFPHLRDKLLPPMDRAVSALIEDLHGCGLLDSTRVVMAGEFGRAPRVTSLPQAYKLPGRDHWGRVQSVLVAGGGVVGGRVIGASDRIGGQPTAEPQSPENLAATMYRALGIPSDAAWFDDLDRPHRLYHGEPIGGLT